MCNIIHLHPYILIATKYLELVLNCNTNGKISIQIIFLKKLLNASFLFYRQHSSSKHSLLCSNYSSVVHPNKTTTTCMKRMAWESKELTVELQCKKALCMYKM